MRSERLARSRRRRPLPGPDRERCRRALACRHCAWLALIACAAPSAPPYPGETGLDLRELSDAELGRVYGSVGDGSLGLSVAGGLDIDGDGLGDAAVAAMQAAPDGIAGAGQIYVAFGDGSVSGAIDTSAPHPRLLRIDGAQPYEYAGSEIWVDDVTGDGLGDLLIGRQNHHATPGQTERRGAGALSIVVGSALLRELAQTERSLKLAAPDAGVSVLTLLGPHADSRLGIWVRSGDVSGDGVADLVVGADQDESAGAHAGAAYVVLGGAHLAGSGDIDLAAVAGTPLAGRVAKLTPPADPPPADYHFGATCQIADLNGNGRGEVLVSAALNRAGAVLDPDGGMNADGSGGPARGVTFIAWDDNFPEPPWPDRFELAIGEGAGAATRLRGSAGNVSFGEELLGGSDWDADGNADLFIGDLAANFAGRPASGSSHIVYDASRLAGFDGAFAELAALDPPLRTATLFGAGPGDISGDTAAAADFSGDGIDDLVVCSPHASPLRRHSAGVIHVLRGRAGGWPALTDLRDPAQRDALGVSDVYGARGSFGNDRGDTLCYSAAAGALDGDGRSDLIANEMVGNGLAAGSIDVGNMILVSGNLLAPGE